MSTTTVPTPLRGERTQTPIARVGLIALAIVIAIAASFILGRATVGATHHSPASAPLPAAGQVVGHSTAELCHVGRAC